MLQAMNFTHATSGLEGTIPSSILLILALRMYYGSQCITT